MSSQQGGTAELGRVLDRILGTAACRFYFDVSPLLDEQWTGIPSVAAGLAVSLLQAAPGRTHFFFEERIIQEGAIVDALARRSGLYLLRDVNNGIADAGRLDPAEFGGEIAVGLYPSVKRIRRVFDLECSVMHDFSTFVTPHFHTLENIDYHLQNVVADIASNDLTFCVSEATLTDLREYLGVAEDKLAIAYNGVHWPADFAIRAANEVDPAAVEPYFLTLATREPRKNIVGVLDMLASFPELMDTHRFVFAGRTGWLIEEQRIPGVLADAVANGRIVFTGFVSEYQKYKLLLGAEATIYPSYYEGFGLPLLESLSVGTPCVTTYSSSLPEVGGDLCFYHDPFSKQGLYAALRAVEQSRPKLRPEYRQACEALADRFTWTRMLCTILEALDPLIARLALDPGRGRMRDAPGGGGG